MRALHLRRLESSRAKVTARANKLYMSFKCILCKSAYFSDPEINIQIRFSYSKDNRTTNAVEKAKPYLNYNAVKDVHSTTCRKPYRNALYSLNHTDLPQRRAGNRLIPPLLGLCQSSITIAATSVTLIPGRYCKRYFVVLISKRSLSLRHPNVAAQR